MFIYRLDSVFVEKILLDLGRSELIGGAGFLSFRFPCMEG